MAELCGWLLLLGLLLCREKGGNPDLVREALRRRYADVGLVDNVIELDNTWRKSTWGLSLLEHSSSRSVEESAVCRAWLWECKMWWILTCLICSCRAFRTRPAEQRVQQSEQGSCSQEDRK